MILGIIFIIMITASVVFGAASGQMSAVSAAAMDGAREAVSLCISLTGVICIWTGFLTVMYLEEHPGKKIHVFNSHSACAGQAAVVHKVYELCADGLSFDEVITAADSYIARLTTLFVLENLDNLRKNGRLNQMQAIITGTLHIKLVMRYSWSFEEVDAKLKGIMEGIFHNAFDASKTYGMEGNLVAGANIAGFMKVCSAMIAQGIAY